MIRYEYTIYTRQLKDSTWECKISGFNSSHEALTWLISSYKIDAGFWKDIEVKVVREVVK